MVNKKIYVSIASYRDPFLQRTIDSLYCEADNPKNITVGCFVQSFPEELLTTAPVNRYGYTVFSNVEEPGRIFSVTECRNKSLKWLNKSYDYVLQIDSHTSFESGWDTYLFKFIEQLNDKKAIVSSVLPMFGIKKDESEIKYPDKVILNLHPNESTSKKAFMNSYELVFAATRGPSLPDTNYANGWYLSGHFIFAPSNYFLEIPQPPWVMFWGEELINSVRAYTAGWNVYIPEDIPLYHLAEHLSEINRPKIWQDFPEGYTKRVTVTTDRIIDVLLNKANEEIFSDRTLTEFYSMLGYNLGELFDEWRREKNQSVLS